MARVGPQLALAARICLFLKADASGPREMMFIQEGCDLVHESKFSQEVFTDCSISLANPVLRSQWLIPLQAYNIQYIRFVQFCPILGKSFAGIAIHFYF